MVYLIGLLFVVIFGGIVCAIVEAGKNDWRNRVTADDIRELGRLFEQENFK